MSAQPLLDVALFDDAASLLDACRARRIRLATAEGCTGGSIAAALTVTAGASDVLDRGFVAYSNQANTELRGVPAELIAAVDAVSDAVARRMAEGALAHSAADIAVAGRPRPSIMCCTATAPPSGRPPWCAPSH